ncbi:MAG: N-formylglutamate amidohydrolase [Planctomycetaceae bacterium]|nr:N-formylglutamate amidohydrolase [Planctomycetaceae bacterium]
MALQPYSIFRRGLSPIVAAAIHQGHDTRPDVECQLAIDDTARRREEDPYTAEWAQVAATQVIGVRSRFEVDLNRPRDKAVYLAPEDAWGLQVWKLPPTPISVAESLREYDAFYRAVEDLIRELLVEHDRIVVYDLHTYNHRRERTTADPATHPEVNIGTRTMDRDYWGPIVDRFIHDLRGYDFGGRKLDVRENVKFYGGHFGRWIHHVFPCRVCSIAVEFRKSFMDEWTGDVDPAAVQQIYNALQSTLSGVREELERR